MYYDAQTGPIWYYKKRKELKQDIKFLQMLKERK